MNRFLALGMAALPMLSCSKAQDATPNIIFILADDLGYGDLGCYGQERFCTPEIDSLAAQGMMFTRHYAGAPVSAPSRSSLITGLHTGHTPIRGNKECPVEGQHPIPGDTWNVFRMAKGYGYVTGVFGKWGLGAPGTEGAPENQGVDEFYGYNCQRLAHCYYPDHLWHNGEKVMLDQRTEPDQANATGSGTAFSDEGRQYAPYLIHEQALEFIRENSGRPFLMMYTTTIPHAELRLPEEELEPFKKKLGPDPEYRGCNDLQERRLGNYGSQEYPHAAFAAMVSLLDRQVGEIADAVEKAGIAGNTIIIFTSDNGPHIEGGADPDFFNSSGGLRGIKRDLYEGGIRVPMIVRWPGKVEPGSKTDHASAFWDFMPTVADILKKYGTPAPEMTSAASWAGSDCAAAATDGISYLPTLTGTGEQQKHEWLYWEFHEENGRQAILKDDWKGIVYDRSAGGKIQLYNLREDPQEKDDVAAEHPDIAEEMLRLMEESRTPSEIFNF